MLQRNPTRTHFNSEVLIISAVSDRAASLRPIDLGKAAEQAENLEPLL